MKVRCINDDGSHGYLVAGQVYDAADEEVFGHYFVAGSIWRKTRFEPADVAPRDTIPAPCCETEER